jgi:hypothetical protein
MMTLIVFRVWILAAALVASACVTSSRPTYAVSAADCENTHTCSVRGLLEMSNDGHAYIGNLKFDDGSCINVSLPESRSRSLADKKPELAELAGRVLPFPYAEGVLGFSVSGRKVGYGKCARYFLFVR